MSMLVNPFVFGGGGGGAAAVVGQSLIYTGNGSSLAVGGADFSPDLAIIRRRNANGGTLSGTSWRWIDNLRGLDKSVSSNVNSAEATDAQFITSMDANGFTVGSSGSTNLSGGDFLALVLQEVANAFDIVLYTGTGVAGTVSHGLGVVPELIIIKNRSLSSRNWRVYSATIGNTKGLTLNDTSTPITSSGYWNDTSPTSTEFTVGTDVTVNENTRLYVAYLFATLNPGVKVGSYTGDGNTNGPAITTGFKPKFIIIKRYDADGNWVVFDDQRDPTSPHNTYQSFNLAGTSADVVTTNSAGGVDFLSTQFQSIDSAAADINISSATYIYLAIA